MGRIFSGKTDDRQPQSGKSPRNSRTGLAARNRGGLGWRRSLPEPEETGTSYIENAELKARAAAKASGLPSLSDDSGLSVAALGGDPGIYSARWAGPEKNFAMAMQRVESELQKQAAIGNSDRSARFVCALTICWPDGHAESVEGHVHGDLVGCHVAKTGLVTTRFSCQMGIIRLLAR